MISLDLDLQIALTQARKQLIADGIKVTLDSDQLWLTAGVEWLGGTSLAKWSAKQDMTKFTLVKVGKRTLVFRTSKIK